MEKIVSQQTSELENIIKIHKDLGLAIEQLSKEHAFQKALLETAPIIIISTDNDGVINYMNPFGEKILGYSLQEVIHQSTPLIFLHAQELLKMQSFRKWIEAGTQELTFVNKEGKEFIWNIEVSPIKNQNVVSGYLFVGQDITAQKQRELEIQQKNEELTATEEELRQNLEELEATQEELLRNQLELQGQLGALHNAALVSETDVEGNIIFANDKFSQVSGFKVDELIGKNFIELKSKEHHSMEFLNKIKSTLLAGNVWQGITCDVKKNGELFWVKATITPVLDKQGKPIKFIFVRFEITEQVQQQLEIQQKNEELTATEEELLRNQLELQGQLGALHNAALVSETDIRGNIIFANQTFASISGYTVEELIGKNHRILKSGKQDDAIFVDMWATIAAGKVWRGIICNKKKNGDFYWVKSTITPVLDKQGIPIKYIGICKKIVEEKHHGKIENHRRKK